MPELYEDLPIFPLPLELIALCMLRILNRKGHEGKLDAASESSERGSAGDNDYVVPD